MKITDLTEYGVSESVIERLTELGFESLTEAQEKSVKSGLFSGKSILVDAPTNTGKTFIGELAALNAAKQKEQKKSFFLVPLKALADQMFTDFVNKYEHWGLQIAISTSDHYEYDNSLLDYDVIICTYEKLDGLLVKKPDFGANIGLVVIDEIQHVGDKNRGVSLEFLLTKLSFFSSNPQLVGLSATTSNSQELANWLKCELIQVETRDVELREGLLYIGSEIVSFNGFTLNKGDFIYKEFNSKNVAVEKELQANNIEQISKLAEHEQFLIFENTQPKAEEKATKIANILRERPEAYELNDQIDQFVESSPSTRILKKTIKKGVAFHHSGLLLDERRIVEEGFRQGTVRIICSTPTLGAGINTPAKNVIILFSKFHDDSPLWVRTYKNISGRAGRLRTSEDFGRSILLARNKRELENLWENYIIAKPETVKSQVSEKIGFDCSLLGLLASKICSTREELLYFMELTFFGFIESKKSPETYKEKIKSEIDQSIDDFIRMNFLIEKEQLYVTELGQRCAQELLSPNTVSFLYNMIKTNEKKITSAFDYDTLTPGLIHLCCCTDDSDNLYYPRSRTEIQELRATWFVNRNSYFFEPQDYVKFAITHRTTRMILRWMEGISYFELSAYAPAGSIKRISGNIHWLLKGLARICEKPLFGFDQKFSEFLYDLAERVHFGVPEDALHIARLRVKGIHRRRSINIANSGYTTIDKLLEVKNEEMNKIPEMGEVLTLRLKEAIEKFIANQIQKSKNKQIRITSKKGKDTNLISKLYDLPGDQLTRHIVKIFNEELGLVAEFVGEDRAHEPDIIVHTDDGDIAIELKRKENGKVSTIESEEILGKGAKYNPIANVTIGYPDFVDVAKENSPSAGITLISVPVFGEILIEYWQNNIQTKEILTILKKGRIITKIDDHSLELS